MIADTQPGLYDAHSRRLPRPALAANVVRLVAPDDRAGLAALLTRAGVAPVVRVVSPRDDVETHVFNDRNGQIVGLQCVAPGSGSETIEVTLPRPMQVTDLRGQRSLGRVQTLSITLDPIEPTLLRVQ